MLTRTQTPEKTTSREYYVYFWFNADGTVYYIGKGKRGRAWETRDRVPYPPTIDHILIVKRGLTNSEALAFERQQILLASKAGFPIVNLTHNRPVRHGYYWSYKERKCRCEDCTNAFRQRHRRDIQARVNRVRTAGAAVRSHNATGYRLGCRCDICRAAQNKKRQQNRLRQKAENPEEFRARNAEYARKSRTRKAQLNAA